MFRNVPECSGMFRNVPGFIDGRLKIRKTGNVIRFLFEGKNIVIKNRPPRSFGRHFDWYARISRERQNRATASKRKALLVG